jgi:hypothetical protein
LSAIMKWVKQTFATRFNRRDGRSGHIWGDQYVSWVMEGEPEEGADSVNAASVGGAGTVPQGGGGDPRSDPSEGNRRERRSFRRFSRVPHPYRSANPAFPPRAPP